mgnify:CR=1 FL=1
MKKNELKKIIREEIRKQDLFGMYKIVGQDGKIKAIELTYKMAMKIIDSWDGQIVPMEAKDEIQEGVCGKKTINESFVYTIDYLPKVGSTVTKVNFLDWDNVAEINFNDNSWLNIFVDRDQWLKLLGKTEDKTEQ